MGDRIEVLAVVPKSVDLEVHVRLLTSGEREILEFVDYVPSLDHYGRGFWLPLTGREQLAELGRSLVERHGP